LQEQFGEEVPFLALDGRLTQAARRDGLST
jgi:hypothetical protein